MFSPSYTFDLDRLTETLLCFSPVLVSSCQLCLRTLLLLNNVNAICVKHELFPHLLNCNHKVDKPLPKPNMHGRLPFQWIYEIIIQDVRGYVHMEWCPAHDCCRSFLAFVLVCVLNIFVLKPLWLFR